MAWSKSSSGSAIHGCRKIPSRLHRCGRRKPPRGRGSHRRLVEGLRARSNRLAEVADVTSARLARSDVTRIGVVGSGRPAKLCFASKSPTIRPPPVHRAPVDYSSAKLGRASVSDAPMMQLLLIQDGDRNGRTPQANYGACAPCRRKSPLQLGAGLRAEYLCGNRPANARGAGSCHVAWPDGLGFGSCRGGGAGR